jgi:acyl carrier protein
MHELETQIKKLIIESLDLEDISISDIESTEALFGDGFGLDSIDALELGLALKKEFNIRLEANSEDSKKHFYSVATLATFVKAQREIDL